MEEKCPLFPLNNHLSYSTVQYSTVQYSTLLQRDSLVKPAPLAGSPAGPVDVTVPRPLHAAVGLPDAAPEECPAGVAGHGPVVEVGGGRPRADGAGRGELPLKQGVVRQ